MNYEKEYNEALKRAKRFYDSNTNEGYRQIFEEIFPELAENEDERIRKRIIEWIEEIRKCNLSNAEHNGDCSEAIAWLKKQGEHANFRNKIQIGDKVTHNEDGVLVNLSQLKRVAKKYEKQGEQKPIIEMKSAEESLGIDSETYNKIVDECIYGDGDNKPAWSEEDEDKMQIIINIIKDSDPDWEELINWLKSLRPQNSYAYNPYKAVVESIAAMVEKYATSDSDLQDFYNNVKVKCKDAKEYNSLYPQNTWKPSDELQSDCTDCKLYEGFGQCYEHGNNLIKNCNDYRKE